MTGALRLRPVRLDDELIATAAHAEPHWGDFTFLLGYEPGEPWAGFVERLERQRCGAELRDDQVAATFLFAEVDGEIAGRVSIRHELNDLLTRSGGHIGYAVLPRFRGRGLAVEILRQGLVIARAAGVERVLVTCDDDNTRSARAIERCGGLLDSVVDQPEREVRLRRYWID